MFVLILHLADCFLVNELDVLHSCAAQVLPAAVSNHPVSLLRHGNVFREAELLFKV